MLVFLFLPKNAIERLYCYSYCTDTKMYIDEYKYVVGIEFVASSSFRVLRRICERTLLLLLY